MRAAVGVGRDGCAGSVWGCRLTPTEIDHLPLSALAALCSLTIMGTHHQGLCASPCRLCNAERAHEGDRRGAVLLRTKGAWTCFGCSVSGSRLDLLTLAHAGVLWRDATREQRDHALGRPAPPVAVQAPIEAPRRYLTPDEARALHERSWEAREDDGCQAWAQRRELLLTPDLRALPKEPDPDLPWLWSKPTERYPEPAWLPGMGYRLWMPTTDGSGLIKGGQLRNTRADCLPGMKERGAVGLTSSGLCYASRSLRTQWGDGMASARPVTIVEGGPDRLAAWMAWGREREIIGIRSGSWGEWCERLHPDTVMITHYDATDKQGRRQGDVYGEQLVKRAPHVRLVSVVRVYEAAGLVGGEGLDLSSPEIVGRWPQWRW